MSAPISPEAIHEWHPDYLPAYLSNGLVGLRVGAAPPLGGMAVVNGFTGPDPVAEVESLVPVPFPLAADIAINGSPMSASPAAALLREQRYDFAHGQLHTALSFTAQGTRVDAEVVTLCNRALPAVVMQELTVVVDAECELELSAGLDPAGRSGGPYLADMGAGGRFQPAHGVLGWNSAGGAASCGLAYLAQLDGADGCPPAFRNTLQGQMVTAYTVRARPGRRYRLRQLTALVPDAMQGSPHLHAVRMLTHALTRGYDALLGENADRWAQLWRGRVELTGAPTRWQAMCDAAHFYLHTSVHRASPCETSPFGMAYWPDYHYYRGHVMWDIETFAVPALILTQPDAARALLHYRSTRLESARHNATAQGYDGAQYPWESSPRAGQEATPVGQLPPVTEHHVSMDIALAFARYVHATADNHFARTEAWPVLSDVARWIASRTNRTQRGYEIHRVEGIAETGTPVNNNAFVNMAAATTLREATRLADALGLPANPAWTHIADNLVLPRDTDGTIINHDGYRPDEPQGATPEAAAGLFPVGYPVDADTEARTLAAAVGRADGYAGSPMLSALLGVYAARLGQRERALDLYEHGFADFVQAPHSLVTETSPTTAPDQPRAAPFTANVGGFLTGCLYGLTGMNPTADEPATWCRQPVRMPQGWEGITVDRLWVRGRSATLTADHGQDHAQLDFL